LAELELAELGEVLHESRMVTINGTGGVGETRVAVQIEALHDAIRHGNYVGSRPVVVEVLGSGPDILLRVAEPSTATVLAGSLLQGALPAINAWAQRNAELERVLVDAREALRDEEYQRLFARGASMSYEEVVEFALDNVHRALAETTAA
jgi:hypothetical protein